MIKIIRVTNRDQISTVADLANEIWHEHYEGIISASQIDYMVAKYQSEGAISCQIKEGYFYFAVIEEDTIAGYMACKKEDNNTVFLSKIYVREKKRGKGYGSMLFQQAKTFAQENGCHRIYLTVNRQNSSSIDIYKRRGFKITSQVDEPIGQGFVMNDFIMDWII